MTATHCAHHWVIDAAAGPLSKGRCRLCGEEKEFSNSAMTRGGWTIQSRVAYDKSEESEASLGAEGEVR